MTSQKILILAAALCPTFAAAAAFRFKLQKKSLGRCLVSFKSKRRQPFFSVILLSLAVFPIAAFRNFSPIRCAALACVPVLCIFVSVGEFLLQKIDGIYENGLVLNGKLYKKADIASFPSLSDRSASESHSIVAMKKNGDRVELTFSSDSDCDAAAKCLSKWNRR